MRYKVLIALIIAVVTLSAGIVLLFLLPESEPEPEPSVPQPTPSGTVADLIYESPDEISSISFIPREGAQYTLRLDPLSGYVEMDADNAVFPGIQPVLQAVFITTTSLININMVTDAADDEMLALFGFDEPEMTIHIERSDGTSVDLLIGASQAAGQGRYARTQNSREVFLLDERRNLLLTQQLDDLYDTSFFPFELFPDEESVIFTIEHILLENGNDIIEVQKRRDEDFEGTPLGSSRFHILQPFIGEGNDHNIQTLLLENIARIHPDSVEKAFPSDLSVYGLHEPTRLTISVENWSRTLLIGSRDPEGEGRYVMIEGYDAVLLDTNGDYSFLNVSPTQLRTALIWLHNIDTVSSIRFDLDGETRILRIEHNADYSSLQGWLDDKEISENNVRKLYIAALMITINGETDEPMPTDEFPVYTVTMYFADGGVDSVELFQLTDSQLLIAHDRASTGFFITRMALQQALLSRFEILDAGEELP